MKTTQPHLLRWTCALFGLFIVFGGHAAARTLYWQSVDVDARLDRDGRLHVRERQHYVFDGDWNGGERRFRLRFGQGLTFERLTRIDPQNGTVHLLDPGDLDKVDHYELRDNVLRWRSRRPTDPLFHDQQIVYVLEYTLSNVLRHQGDTYVLDHNLNFPDRPGSFKHFSGQISLDPVWKPEGELAGIAYPIELSDVPPEQSTVVHARLRYLSQGRPASAAQELPSAALAALGVALAIAMAVLYARFRRRERHLGRTAPLGDRVDRSFIETHLLSLAPEEAGALWDRTVGAPEVGAVIARLVGEGKLSTRVLPHRELELTVRVKRNQFGDPERALIDGLFFEGRTTVDTALLRDHYREHGFDPAACIRSALDERLAKRAEFAEVAPPVSYRRMGLLLAVSVAVWGIGALQQRSGHVLWVVNLVLLGTLMAVLPPSIAVAAWLRKRVQIGHGPLFCAIVPSLPLLVLVLVLSSLGLGIDGWLLVAMVGLSLTFFDAVLNVAMARDGAATIVARRRLAAIRDYFREQLRKERPLLDDAWFPYVLAFGLESTANHWFSRFGQSSAPSWTTTREVDSSASSWTGGGGAFGGAGASASWTTALNGVSSGVASSSSSSSSGDGGGSSGGGGGGGW